MFVSDREEDRRLWFEGHVRKWWAVELLCCRWQSRHVVLLFVRGMEWYSTRIVGNRLLSVAEKWGLVRISKGT